LGGRSRRNEEEKCVAYDRPGPAAPGQMIKGKKSEDEEREKKKIEMWGKKKRKEIRTKRKREREPIPALRGGVVISRF